MGDMDFLDGLPPEQRGRIDAAIQDAKDRRADARRRYAVERARRGAEAQADGMWYMQQLMAIQQLPQETVCYRRRSVLAMVWTYQQGESGAFELPLPEAARLYGYNAKVLGRDLAYLCGLGLVVKHDDDRGPHSPKPASYSVDMAAVLDLLAATGREEWADWDKHMPDD